MGRSEDVLGEAGGIVIPASSLSHKPLVCLFRSASVALG